MNSTWIKVPKVRAKPINKKKKILVRSTNIILCDLTLGNSFLDIQQKHKQQDHFNNWPS